MRDVQGSERDQHAGEASLHAVRDSGLAVLSTGIEPDWQVRPRLQSQCTRALAPQSHPKLPSTPPISSESFSQPAPVCGRLDAGAARGAGG